MDDPVISSRRRVAAGLLAGAALAYAQAIPELGFTTRASPALAKQYAGKFSAPAADRITAWAGEAGKLKAAGIAGKLAAAKGREDSVLQDVNDAINKKMRWVEDKTLWRVTDYWATPAESISMAAGDCEDFAIAKYYLLKELGVPLARLRITYVRMLRRGGAAHMVLAYYATPEAEPFILDNVDGAVRSASKRDDLEPVYYFNDDELLMVKERVRGKPQIRAWLDMQGRLVAESLI